MCNQISDYCYYRFLDDGLSIFSLTNYKTKREPEIGDCWRNFLDVFQKYDSRKRGSNLYQYGPLYLIYGARHYLPDDIPELTTEQVDYIRSQQEKSITIVSNPEDSHYEPDEEKRLTAARKLKVKELCMRCRHELCIRRKEYIN